MKADKIPPPGRFHQERQRRRFFAGLNQFRGDEVILSPSESHHLIRVVRLAVGDRVEVSDGCGRIFEAEILSLEPTAARLRLLNELSVGIESSLKITLGLALVRAEIFDSLIRQVTELGIYRLVPFTSTRSLVRPGGWKKSRLLRWQRLAQEALKSSQRLILPEIDPPVDFPDALIGPEEVKLMFWEEQRQAHRPHDLAAWPRPRTIRALIGPEGGFTAAEADTARQAGFNLLGLGPRRLRVETAALAAVAVLQYTWGDLNP
ncbi:RsmE family RNA methyltransferase [Desulfobacca acetoxidans]|uniref:Ribosomal RNA small subunit methyltransferase E n=1 Tax=Desulfobacca acetoxidans (strain ATCC 700848 / DSM 11109 / ASRB2) TaxID=880072 RepID=F2NJA5_DESAR|nr:RsmE family RNA methyltransferase [Desulfobacca acetoxidans]AEB09277.1 Ribosomal RNA small subunit methyltransferase E [Desulfobacca acetoxidans DSM 11109]